MAKENFRITTRELKDGTIKKCIILDKANATKDDIELINTFYIPNGYLVKYKTEDIYKKDKMLDYVKKYDAENYAKWETELKAFMKAKPDFKKAYPKYPKKP